MSHKPPATRNDDLACIHINKQQSGITEKRYREIVKLIVGTRSSADADKPQRKRLIIYLSLINMNGDRRDEACPGFCYPILQTEAKINCAYVDSCRQEFEIRSKEGGELTPYFDIPEEEKGEKEEELPW